MVPILRALEKFISSNLSRTFAYPFHTTKALYSTELAPAEPDDLFSKVVVEVRGHDVAVLHSYFVFVSKVSDELGINFKKRRQGRFIERWSILKSRYSNRKHMRQYEMRTHSIQFNFTELTGSTCSTLLEYIQRNLPAGVAMHVHQTKLTQLPFEVEINEGEKASSNKSI